VNALIEPWSYPFMRWALLSCLVLGGIHAYLGFHVVRRGVLFVDLAMAQMAALGAAVGVVLGLEHDTPGEYALSLTFALAAAGLFAIVRSRRVSHEAIIATVYGVASAATFVVLEHSPHGLEEVKHLFVGQILTVPPSKVLLTAGVYAVVGVAYVVLHSRVLAVSEGRPVGRRRWMEFFFYGTFAVVVTSSVSLVGVLLVFCFLVLPAIAGVLLATRDVARLAVGWTVALVGGLVGLHAAYHLDQPAGPAIVLTLGVLLAVAAVVARWTRRASGRGAAG
jgi:zinc/manganese transport system permease protein